MDDRVLLGAAVLAALIFPIIAVSFYNWRQRRHDRRMGRRRNDKHKLL